MRWVQITDPEGHHRAGVLKDGEVRALAPGTSILGLLGDGDLLRAAGERATSSPDAVVPVHSVRVRAPIGEPPSIRDFLAFEEHIRNARGGTVDPEWYELPVFYFSNPAAVHDPGQEVAVPPLCQAWDYELEVAAVVGRHGADLDAEHAEDVLAGLMIMNDWSARDLQRREMAQLLGPAKGKDSATTLGPVLVTLDELVDRRSGKAWDLPMTATVNGRPYSRGNLADLHWSFAEMLAYASRGTRVRPGDVIGSGTCGTGCILELSQLHGSDQYPWLGPGDEVVFTVDGGLGEQRARVVAATLAATRGRPPGHHET